MQPPFRFIDDDDVCRHNVRARADSRHWFLPQDQRLATPRVYQQLSDHGQSVSSVRSTVESPRSRVGSWHDRSPNQVHPLARDGRFQREAPPPSHGSPPAPRPAARWTHVYSEPLTVQRVSDASVHSAKIKRNFSTLADQSRTPSPVKQSEAHSPDNAPVVRPKLSRYLREIDRRQILARLSKGEKQSALAKEYQVSRSTICNLLKQRDVVLARQHENPLSRHPKKARQYENKRDLEPATTEGSLSNHEQLVTRPSPRGSDDDIEHEHEHEPSWCRDDPVQIVQSRALALIQTVLYDHHTSALDFQRYSARLLRLLLEESLAIVAEQSGSRRLCAVSMEQQCSPMLNTVHQLEPRCQLGAIQQADASELVLCGSDLPCHLRGCDVLLLEVVIDSGEFVCAAIATALKHGAHEASISLVAVAVAAPALARVRRIYPHVAVITTHVDTVHLHDDHTSPAVALRERVYAVHR